MTEQEVRANWDEALTRWENGEFALSSVIGWGFYPQDLIVLCCMHEAGMHQESIVDLLEDCNFHTECGLIDDGKYDECRRVIFDDMKGESIPLF